MFDLDCLKGLKFTNRDMYLFERLIDLAPTILGRRLNMISGPDECHLAAMAVGADAAIGTLCKCPGYLGGDPIPVTALDLSCSLSIPTIGPWPGGLELRLARSVRGVVSMLKGRCATIDLIAPRFTQPHTRNLAFRQHDPGILRLAPRRF